MDTTGQLVNDKIIVEKPKDAGRLFNKSHFGKTLSENKLELDLIEGSFLLNEGKIDIIDNKKSVDFQKIVKIASKKIADFEIKYLVFKDLRSRGHAIRLNDFGFSDFKNKFVVSVFSEKNFFDLKKTKQLIKKVSKENINLWFAIVDEEGDITYYDVSFLDLEGFCKKSNFKKNKAILLDNRVIVFDKDFSKDLFEKEFYGKAFGDGLQLSFIEALYLLENNIIDITDFDCKKISETKLKEIFYQNDSEIDYKFAVFKDLKKRNLIVKTGFKFGTDFRAYTKSPDIIHAEYLVQVVPVDFCSVWSDVSRAVRLAHSVNKEIVFASFNKKNADYIKFGRLRP